MVVGLKMLVGWLVVRVSVQKGSAIEMDNASVAEARYLGKEAAYGIQLCYYTILVSIPYCLHMFN